MGEETRESVGWFRVGNNWIAAKRLFKKDLFSRRSKCIGYADIYGTFTDREYFALKLKGTAQDTLVELWAAAQ